MYGKKLILTLTAAGLLVFGIGVSGAVADDNQPAPPPVACASIAPGGNDEADAADAVSNAADNVSVEADNQQGDDQQGDQQDQNDDNEQGDCNDEDNGDQGDDNGDN